MFGCTSLFIYNYHFQNGQLLWGETIVLWCLITLLCITTYTNRSSYGNRSCHSWCCSKVTLKPNGIYSFKWLFGERAFSLSLSLCLSSVFFVCMCLYALCPMRPLCVCCVMLLCCWFIFKYLNAVFVNLLICFCLILPCVLTHARSVFFSLFSVSPARSFFVAIYNHIPFPCFNPSSFGHV